MNKIKATHDNVYSTLRDATTPYTDRSDLQQLITIKD